MTPAEKLLFNQTNRNIENALETLWAMQIDLDMTKEKNKQFSGEINAIYKQIRGAMKALFFACETRMTLK